MCTLQDFTCMVIYVTVKDVELIVQDAKTK